ncbi:MAG: hypothetical protein JO235_18210 [Chroococcidiopsidaceae cyanobacterium CP_BM_RX_35]|nr:hypothetical protein [Chroococcidiopsidaceae cyanobacterium CP_BM_RX_35]
MSKNLEQLLTSLKQEADLIDKISQNLVFRYKSSQRLILETGIPFLTRVEPTPFQGEAKQCFQNCFTALEKYPKLHYCEGFAMNGMLPVAISHAWLVNAKLEVIDPTWYEEKSLECTYFGAVFEREFVLDFFMKIKRYGILENDFLNSYCLKQEGFPKWALCAKFHVES